LQGFAPNALFDGLEAKPFACSYNYLALWRPGKAHLC